MGKICLPGTEENAGIFVEAFSGRCWNDYLTGAETNGNGNYAIIGCSEGDGHSLYPSISSDGRYVAFESGATNLVDGDTNDTADIFVHDRTAGQTTRVSVDELGGEADNGSFKPSISSDGQSVAFASWATNLVDDDTNGVRDIFIHDSEEYLHCGDCNLDDELTPGDALLAFQHYLGMADPPLDSCQLDQAEVTLDDDITPADALCIFQKYLGISSCLDDRPECPWD